VEKKVVKIDNPAYMTQDEIRRNFWNHQVLMTNMQMTPMKDTWAGGIVRYYADESMDELYAILGEIRRTEDDGAIGGCSIRYIGNIHINLYAAGGDE
jgi:hypothetical protein